MWINLVCGLIFFLMVPGILFTVPSQSKYITATAHAVLFVIVHHVINAYLKKHFCMEEPTLPATKPSKPVVTSVTVTTPEKKVVIVDPRVAETHVLENVQKAQLLENVPEKVY